MLRETKGFFCFSFNKRSQNHATAKRKHKPAVKNAVQCFSSNLKATCKNSDTFEKKVDFPLSMVFNQALFNL